MYFHSCLLALTMGLAAAEEVQRRGFAIRPGRVDHDTPSPPKYHSSADDVPYIGSTAHIGDDTAEATAEYHSASKPNECLRETCAELTQEVAEQVIEQMLNNFLDSSSSSATSQAIGTQVQQPIVTAYATGVPVPHFNVAKAMTLEKESLALFNDEEQYRYFHDRMCFYANVEQRYASAATASPLPTRVARRGDVLDVMQSAETDEVSTTPLASADAAYYQEDLWKSYMPDKLLSIYTPATANGSMTTTTTTCSGLGNAPSITMSYVQALVSTHSPTPTPNDNMSEGAANEQAKAEGSAIFGAVVALVGLIAL